MSTTDRDVVKELKTGKRDWICVSLCLALLVCALSVVIFKENKRTKELDDRCVKRAEEYSQLFDEYQELKGIYSAKRDQFLSLEIKKNELELDLASRDATIIELRECLADEEAKAKIPPKPEPDPKFAVGCQCGCGRKDCKCGCVKAKGK